jgi:hypothetical protein
MCTAVNRQSKRLVGTVFCVLSPLIYHIYHSFRSLFFFYNITTDTQDTADGGAALFARVLKRSGAFCGGMAVEPTLKGGVSELSAHLRALAGKMQALRLALELPLLAPGASAAGANVNITATADNSGSHSNAHINVNVQPNAADTRAARTLAARLCADGSDATSPAGAALLVPVAFKMLQVSSLFVQLNKLQTRQTPNFPVNNPVHPSLNPDPELKRLQGKLRLHWMNSWRKRAPP